MQYSKCIQCISGHVIDESNPLACKEKIEGCLLYENKTIGNETIEICIECKKEGYFIQEDFTCGKCSDVCSNGECEYTSNNCKSFNCNDIGCMKCSESNICEQCLTSLPVENGWCGTELCIELLDDNRCDMCLHYSYETYYDKDYETFIPFVMNYYLPNNNGQCIQLDNPSDYDITEIIIIVSIAFILFIIAIGMIICFLLLMFYQCLKQKSTYEDLK